MFTQKWEDNSKDNESKQGEMIKIPIQYHTLVKFLVMKNK